MWLWSPQQRWFIRALWFIFCPHVGVTALMPPKRVLILSKHEFDNFSTRVRFIQPSTGPPPPSPLCWIKSFPSDLNLVHFDPKLLGAMVYPWSIYNGGRLTRDRWIERKQCDTCKKQLGVNGWPAFCGHVCGSALRERGDLDGQQRGKWKKGASSSWINAFWASCCNLQSIDCLVE